MADIFHSFTINAPLRDVFEGISTTKGLDNWWTKTSEGKPVIDEMYKLHFGPQYHWSGIVSKYAIDKEFELIITDAHVDWIDTKVGFLLMNKNDITEVHFCHKGWPQNNEHYRISCYCWAMYLRILKRYLEYGEQVPYENRLNV
jgi:uncharacterized protein YndB with AHSA1/START domain